MQFLFPEEVRPTYLFLDHRLTETRKSWIIQISFAVIFRYCMTMPFAMVNTVEDYLFQVQQKIKVFSVAFGGRAVTLLFCYAVRCTAVSGCGNKHEKITDWYSNIKKYY